MCSSSSVVSHEVWSTDESYLSAHQRTSWHRTSSSSKALTSESVLRLGKARSRLDEQLDTEMYLIAHERRFASAQIYDRNAATKLPLQEKYLKLLGLAVQGHIRVLHKNPPLPQWTSDQLVAHATLSGGDSANILVSDTLSIALQSPSNSPETTPVATVQSRSQATRLKPLDEPDQLSLPPVEPLFSSPSCPNVDSRGSSHFDSTDHSGDIKSVDSVSSISSSDMVTAKNSALEYSINENVRKAIARASDFSPVIPTSSAMIMASISAPFELSANGASLLSPTSVNFADSRARVSRNKRRRIHESKGDHDKTGKELCTIDVGELVVSPKPGYENEAGMPMTRNHLRLPPLKHYFQSSEHDFGTSSTSLSKYHISNSSDSGYSNHPIQERGTNTGDGVSHRLPVYDAYHAAPLETIQQHSARPDRQELSLKEGLTSARSPQSTRGGPRLTSPIECRGRADIRPSQEDPALHQPTKRVRFDSQ